MLTTSLSPTEVEAVLDAWAGPHEIRTIVELWDLEHNFLADLTGMWVSGQTNDDTTAEVQSSASVELFDPMHESGLDDLADLAGSRPPDRLIHAKRGVHVPTLGRWVDLPVFTGVVDSLGRAGDMLSLTCLSKEQLARDEAWNPYVVKSGTNKIVAVERIMRDMCGETFFDLTPASATFTKDYVVGIDMSPWQAVKEIVNSLGMVAFYDARGYLKVRPPSTAPNFTLRDRTGGLVCSPVTRGYGADGVVNAVRIIAESGSKTIDSRAVAPGDHPYAPSRLGRNGVPRYVWGEAGSDNTEGITTRTQGDALAALSLNQALLDSVELAYEMIPNLFLEAGDQVLLDTEGFSGPARYRQGSRPWGLGLASFGHLSRVSRKAVSL